MALRPRGTVRCPACRTVIGDPLMRDRLARGEVIVCPECGAVLGTSRLYSILFEMALVPASLLCIVTFFLLPWEMALAFTVVVYTVLFWAADALPVRVRQPPRRG